MGAPTLNDLFHAWLINQGSDGIPYNWKGPCTLKAAPQDIAGSGKILLAGEQLRIRDIEVGGDISGYLTIAMGGTTYSQVFFDANTNYGRDFEKAIIIDGPGTVSAILTIDVDGNSFANVNVSKITP